MSKNKRFLVVKEQTPTVHQGHPFHSERNHRNLIEYVRDRLDFAKNNRDALADRFDEIDRDLSGFLKLSEEDRKRRIDNLEGKEPKPTAIKPQFALTQLNRGVTFLLSVFSPEGGMYEAIAQGDDQKIANALTELMNQDSQHAAHFRHKAVFFLTSLKYNLGALHVEWAQEFGPRVTGTAAGGVEIQDADPNTPLWEGNRLRAVDMYNCLWDPTVYPVDIYSKGEFCGEVEVHSPFRIQRMAEAGEIFNVNRYINATSPRQPPQGESLTYYRAPPEIRTGVGSTLYNSDGSLNWMSILSAGTIQSDEVAAGVEFVNVYIRLLPKEFGLVSSRTKDRDRLEIWRLTIANGQHLTAAEHINNIHSWIPYVFAVPQEDNLGLESKSIGENLIPLQDFAVFLLNSHVKSTRKNLYDLIVYDPQIVDLSDIGDDVAARIPAKSFAGGKDIAKSIWKPDLRVDTSRNMDDIERTIELMEYFFATRTVQQVAGLERATQYQAAAVVQGSHRDLWRYAKVVDDQAMQPSRQMQYSNVIQFGDVIEVIGPDGQRIEVSPGQIANTNIQFAIGEGLKSIDRMTVVQNLKEIINAIIQNQAALAEFDVPGLLNWWSTLFGVQQDLSAFRRQVTGTPPPPGSVPEGTEGAPTQ